MLAFVRPALAATLCLTASAIWLPARAQIDSREGIALQNQIFQLRQELKAVQDRGGGRAAPREPAYNPPASQYGGDMVAQLLTRVDALEDQVRQLRGRIDETQNQVQRQGADLGKRIDDLAFQANPQGRSSQFDPPQGGGQGTPPSASYAPGGGQAASGNPQAGSLSGQGPAAGPQASARSAGPRTPELALQDGNAALSRRDYQAAEAAARSVLMNRTSPRAYDAQILLAQALSGERQYAQAAIAFDDAYNRSRKGSHAQDALIGLAGSLAAINEKKASCDTLTRLRTEFPQPRPDVRDSMTTVGQKAGCH